MPLSRYFRSLKNDSSNLLFQHLRFFRSHRFISISSSLLNTSVNCKRVTMKFAYPKVRRDESVVEDHFGVKVADPYRWLEDPDSEETRQFVEEQNKITRSYLAKCQVTEKIRDNLTRMWNFERYSSPFQYGQFYYYWKNDGLQNQSVLYQLTSLDDKSPKVFLDPNAIDANGLASIRTYSFSEAGKLLCYGVSYGGSDWTELKFKDCSTGKDLDDCLRRVKFTSLAWTHDEQGLFYCRYPPDDSKQDGTETATNKNQKLMYHRLGQDQEADDVLCVERPDQPEWGIGAEVSDCGRYLFVTFRQGCEPNNQLFYYDLSKGINGKLTLTPIVDSFEAVFDYITTNGSIVTLRTNLDAPMYKLINIDLDNPGRANWTDLIQHDDASLLDSATCVNKNKLIINRLIDVKANLSIHDLATGVKIQDLNLPLGSVQEVVGRKRSSMVFVKFVSFLTPGEIFYYNFEDPEPKLQLFLRVKLNTNIDLASLFEAKQVFYQSTDGTRIPMFIIGPKNNPMDGSGPCKLYGYGGFDIALTPSFSLANLFFLMHFNGTIAIANLRGGGEYGNRWHDAGRLHNKQNVFNDFQSAAEYLVKEKYTCKEKLFIVGGSNGGLLVCTCLNQRPDLFGAAIAQVPVCDMLRFHKFTIGHAWVSDFGDPDADEKSFTTLMSYSPLHNIRPPKQDSDKDPALLVLTADHDDRVVPLHTFKFIAQLQHTRGSEGTNYPLVARIETQAGHGAGKPTSKQIDELTDTFAFLDVAIGLDWKD